MKQERVDSIGFGNLRLVQQPEDFCYGVDAVLLADFAAARLTGGERVLDLGTGNGILPLILSHKATPSKIYGLDIQEGAAGLARRNAELNGLGSLIEILHGDVRDLGESLLGELAGRLDAVVTNPPYVRSQAGLRSENPSKSIARHEIHGSLEDFLAAAARMLKGKGSLFMVHRPSRLADLMAFARERGLEPKTLRMVAPDAESAPNLVLIHYIKGGRRELTLLPTLAVYGRDRAYTPEILTIYEK